MSIIYPMGLLAVFTLLYASVMITGRVKAVKRGDIKAHYFKEYTSDVPPGYVQKPTRQWANLFEVPVLFYAACLAILVLNLSDAVFIYMAWGFLIMRLLQALIHTTYNHVIHRMLAFFIGHVLILAMWIRLMLMV